jgi:hypothetical protein
MVDSLSFTYFNYAFSIGKHNVVAPYYKSFSDLPASDGIVQIVQRSPFLKRADKLNRPFSGTKYNNQFS